MITVTGTYTDTQDRELEYRGRVFLAVQEAFGKPEYVNGIGEGVLIEDGDVLIPFGGGTWFAHYKDKTRLPKKHDATLATQR